MLARLSFLLALFVTLIGCSKSQPETSEQNPLHGAAARTNEQTLTALADFQKLVESARTSPPAQRLVATQFFANITLGAYEKFGRKNPKWDDHARTFLSRVASDLPPPITLQRTNDLSPELLPKFPRVEEAAAAVAASGCDDPLVRYLVLRQQHEPLEGGASVTNLWVQIADEIEQTDHHVFWKFFARLNAAYALRAEARKAGVRSNTQEMGNLCNALSVEMFQDHSLPIEAIFAVVDELYLKEINKRGLAEYCISFLQPLLLDGWGDTAEAWFCVGRFHIRQAWDKRGSGDARKVTTEGWQAMAEHLGIARLALQKSWEIKPSEETAIQMLAVEIGNTQGREAMEKWFERAIAHNPASWVAVRSKFQWLTRAWHGSDALVIEFGQNCVTNPAFRGRIPLLNYEIHGALAEIYVGNGKGTEEDYWREPGVWPDVKATFERFFELNPENNFWRYDYAMSAHRSGAWKDFHTQVKLLKEPIDYERFGGKPSFDRMLTEANAAK